MRLISETTKPERNRPMNPDLKKAIESLEDLGDRLKEVTIAQLDNDECESILDKTEELVTFVMHYTL